METGFPQTEPGMRSHSCMPHRKSRAHLRCSCIREVAISAAASLPAALTAPALVAAAAASSALRCMLSWPHCRDASSRSSYASCKAEQCPLIGLKPSGAPKGQSTAFVVQVSCRPKLRRCRRQP